LITLQFWGEKGEIVLGELPCLLSFNKRVMHVTLIFWCPESLITLNIEWQLSRVLGIFHARDHIDTVTLHNIYIIIIRIKNS